MKKTKLINLLETFSKKELRQFRDFIFSPYHNSDEAIQHLYLQLLEASPSFDPDKIQKEKIYFKLFPGNKKYDDLKMRHLTNLLYSSCLDYLHIADRQKKPQEQQITVISQFRKRGLNSSFTLQYEKVQSQFAETKVKDAGSYYDQYLLNNEYHLFLEGQHKREQEPNIQNVSDSLDYYYIASKLKIYCSALNYGNMINMHYDIQLIDAILKQVEEKQYKDIPAIFIYYKIILMLNDPQNNKHYYELKESLLRHLHFFETAEQTHILVLAKNYCIKKLNTGHSDFIRELFELYKLEFSTEVIPAMYSLSPLTYKNVVSIGLRLDEFDWVFDFIEKYKTFLPAGLQESTYSFNMAKYFFAVKEFSKVIKLLNKVEDPDIFLQIDVKILLLKTYYEKTDLIICESLVKTLNHFIKRKTLLSYHKNSYQNFLLFFDRLVKAEHSPSRIKNNISEITQTKELIDKDWLKEKFSNL